MKIFKKYQILQKAYYEKGYGELFEPRNAHKQYDVDFLSLVFREDYDVTTSVLIGITIEPTLELKFTDTGIKKLLKTNRKIRDEVEKLYCEELKEPNFTKSFMRLLQPGYEL